MLKKIITSLVFAGIISVFAYELPGVREVNGVQVHLLPEQTGKQVEFTFDKRDLNGYSGSDAAVFSLFSPSNKLVWEQTVPDDGTTTGNWKSGPRQLVKCSFKAEEKGLYCMKVNTPSSVDMMLLFDRSTVQNASWAIVGGSFRFSDAEKKKFHAYILLAPNALGEKREQTMQVRTTPHSNVKKMTLIAGSKVIVPETDVENPAKKEGLKYHKFPVIRLEDEDIYELKADAFADVAPLQFPQYGQMHLFAERKHAEAFRKVNRSIENDSLLTLKSQVKYADMAFARGITYQFEFIPKDRKADFSFDLNLFGSKYRFTSSTGKNAVAVPLQNAYTAVDLSAAPAGKLLITRAGNISKPMLPESGTAVTAETEFVWTAQLGVREYTVQFKNLENGKITSVKCPDNHIVLADISGNLVPGVWQWSVSVDGDKDGTPAFFIIPQKTDTELVYFHDFIPFRDSAAGSKPGVISVKIGSRKTSDLDFKQSKIVINGKSFMLEAIAPDTVGLKNIPVLKAGFNTVAVTTVDKSGNASSVQWGFFGTKVEDRKLSHDAEGNIFFNGVPFFPVIYYGYNTNQPLERRGFNTLLLNTLAGKTSLDAMLKRNLKALDSGSVYHGYYSKGSTPEADVKKYAGSSAVRHPARLAAWMDEMDVHRPLEKIREFLALYGPAENGWRGVCSCNRALYPAMAECGDYLMIDYYASGRNLFSMDEALKQARKAAGNKPLMFLTSGFSSIDPALTGFIPTPKDVEYAAFSALRHKVNALGLYQCGSYRMERYPDAWKSATGIYRNVSSLSSVLYGKDVPEKVTAEARTEKIVFRAIEFENRLYIIAQNSSFEPEAARFNVKSAAETPVKVLFENRTVTIKNGIFMDGFSAAGTHVYVVELR